MDARLLALEEKVDRLLSMAADQQPVQQRLDRHISFIENVYSRLRYALSYVTPTLPSIPWRGDTRREETQQAVLPCLPEVGSV